MGARLVTLVLTYWTDLPDRQFRILVRMAHTALDTAGKDHPAETYWGGHELLAMTLRASYPDDDGEEARKARTGALRNVRREVAALRKAGACRVADTGRAVRQGHSQVYLLTLGPPDRAGSQRPSSAGSQRPSSAGSKQSIEQGHSDPPRNQEEPSQELSHLDIDGSAVNASVEDRTRARDPDQDFSGGDDGKGHPDSRAPGTATDRAYKIVKAFGRGNGLSRDDEAALYLSTATLLGEGTDEALIRAALTAWHESGKPPEALPEFVEPPAAPVTEP